MNRKDPSFRNLTGAIQVHYRELRTEGVGAVVKHAPTITPQEENMLWESKVIGVHTPLLLYVLFSFMLGRCFVLEGEKSRGNLNAHNLSVSTILIVIPMLRMGQRLVLVSTLVGKTKLYQCFHAQRPNLAVCWICVF